METYEYILKDLNLSITGYKYQAFNLKQINIPC